MLVLRRCLNTIQRPAVEAKTIWSHLAFNNTTSNRSTATNG